MGNTREFVAGKKNGERWYWKLHPFISEEDLKGKRITAVIGIIKDDDKYLCIKNKRGWDLPGGHTEQGESIYHTLKREVWEEARVSVENFTPIALLESSLNPKAHSYMAFITADLADIEEFSSTREIQDRAFISEKDLVARYHGNKRLLGRILDYTR